MEIVGQKEKPFVQFGIDVMNTPQLLWIKGRTFRPGQTDSLIAAQATSFVHRTRSDPGKDQIVFGSDDEIGTMLMKPIEPKEIDVTFVHDIEGPGLEKHVVQKMDIVHLTARNAYKRWDTGSQVQLGMNLDGTLVTTVLSPGKQRQTQIDDGGIQGVNRSLEIHGQGLMGVKSTGLVDENQGDVSIDFPVACFVGLGQRVAGYACLESGMIEFWSEGSQAGFDISERLSGGELSEGHAVELIETEELSDAMVSAIATDA